MPKTMTGGCLCGAVRYSVIGDPVHSLTCHCTSCQKQSGTAFAMIIGFPDAAVTLEGALTTYVDHGDSGGILWRKFCPTCGSPVCSELERTPGMTWIKTGTLDDAKHMPPQLHAWSKSKQDWLELGDVPCFEENPG